MPVPETLISNSQEGQAVAGELHSVARAEDGTVWIPGTSSELRATTDRYPDGFPGLDEPTWLNQILHVSEEGKVLDRMNVLDLLYENNLERHIVQAYEPQVGDEPRTRDITHMNDIEPLPTTMADEYPLFETGDLLVSLRKIHLVFVVDPESKQIKLHTSEHHIQQHDPDFIGNGWIGIFDNNRDFTERGSMLGGSRIVAVQPHTDSVEVRFPTPHSDPFFTDTMGKWQQLPNGNMLLTETRAGRVVEVASNGETVWEWVIEPYSASKVSRISKATRHDVTWKDVSEWPCSSTASAHAIQ